MIERTPSGGIIVRGDQPEETTVSIVNMGACWHVLLEYASGKTFMSRTHYATEAEAEAAARVWITHNAVLERKH